MSLEEVREYACAALSALGEELQYVSAASSALDEALLLSLEPLLPGVILEVIPEWQLSPDAYSGVMEQSMLYGAYLEPVPYVFEDLPQADCCMAARLGQSRSAAAAALAAAAAALAAAVAAPTRRLQHTAARGGA